MVFSTPALSPGEVEASPVAHQPQPVGTDHAAEAVERYRYLFESINDALFIHDLKGQFLEVNAAACRQLGYTNAELLGMTVAELDAPKPGSESAGNWARLIQQGEVVVESAHRRKDGSVIPVELNARLIERDGQKLVLTVARDITERKRTEEELRRLNAQVQQLATIAERERISRELHDGLAQVLGYISLKGESAHTFLHSGEPEQADRSINEIIEVAQRSYTEVREAILDLRTHITQGIGLQSVLDEYLHRFSRDWGVETRLIVIDDELSRFAPPVEVQLLRVIQEALTNVRRHAQARHATVRFDPAGAQRVRVSIDDDGCGFDPGERRMGCFGLLGLRERVESVGGELAITSRPGQGTCVAVILPRRP